MVFLGATVGQVANKQAAISSVTASISDRFANNNYVGCGRARLSVQYSLRVSPKLACKWTHQIFVFMSGCGPRI